MFQLQNFIITIVSHFDFNKFELTDVYDDVYGDIDDDDGDNFWFYLAIRITT